MCGKNLALEDLCKSAIVLINLSVLYPTTTVYVWGLRSYSSKIVISISEKYLHIFFMYLVFNENEFCKHST